MLAENKGEKMILIKGMEPPKCCADCFAYDDMYDYPTCLITSRSKGYNFHVSDSCMDDCPLQQIIFCKNCKWSKPHEYFEGELTCTNTEYFDLEYGYMVVNDDFFCAKGELKED